MKTIKQIADALTSGATTSRDLTEQAFKVIDDPSGEGARAFIKLHREKALAEADASDALRRNGIVSSPLAGIPISLKDLFDEAGEVTKAGSVALNEAAAASTDCLVVARLRAAGAVIVGRTNMTEFAFSGLGLNPHYGTPKNPFDRENGRIPGGSTSGGAVSVADGMAVAAIGSDTGGSVRIPSALCGLTGFKPTARRIPLSGVYPLSSTLDSVGPLAPSLHCCALLDSVMAGEAPTPVTPQPVAGLRLAIPQSFVLEDLDDKVAQTFERAVAGLRDAGAHISEIPLTELLELPQINASGGFAPVECFAHHRPLLQTAGDQYDPRVRARIDRGEGMAAADYVDLLKNQADLKARVSAITSNYDSVIMPTVPLVAPLIADLADDDDYHRVNMLMLRNPSVGNFLDRCAVSLPIHHPGDAPVGLMVMGETMGDAKLKAVALGIEGALAKRL